MATLSFRNVKKTYAGNVPVIHGIDMDIADGEFIVIVGPSGCGKSTLMRMVAGLETVTSGEIIIDGKPVNDLEPAERDIAMVFQNYALYPHMSVFENMAYGLKIRKVPKAEIQKRVEAAAQILELGKLLDRRPRQLSGGQRQRVAMGRAIVREPKVFLFDEPLSNLDAKLRVAMRLEILKLHRRLNTTSLYVTHDQVEAMTLAHRMVVMYQGVPEQIGTPMEVFDKPASTFVAGFIGSPPMNLVEVDVAGDGTMHTAEGTALQISPVQVPAAVRGRKVIMGLRPEHMLLNAQGIPVVIEMIETLGSEQLVHGRNGKNMIVVRCSTRQLSESTVKVGETMNIGPDGRHELHWFEADTGRRVAGL
ncbi:sn-glycerol-3-phosphate import ATP-binding protein UgpC [Bordetella pseudohinzii]|uniref:Sn-glycerol-3-phosphate ABC transporter ATP-binding protein UgpC n=1 Tax=Bordetella pseudohinzii TaxID=1331258 RepID=A0A0J6BTS2_9BORD|nr:sn-glycerol-3-phosphate import ATP-binding protein UgpC [Bordetella pseudohinzii]ANY16284.1 sn-glycerol-3-phosphate ABC transporter ATP-binding protein UgpC [Bordetella pseudohinzii]KMM25214.1 glycerol-3-phosphate transporter ATP-binding subunit [Bordetella pseudohinzii]KXA75939.1 glycerol-3-phosphate transporter ATP-binding subunit [Bordetella pseudohinzii]KXA78014.1 glycerol-3-phosphate transporter ATP-binding subunit [Bordetella pseudohinzii]CUJ14296.1 sn-glycerol-3-phosphate import ATP-